MPERIVRASSSGLPGSTTQPRPCSLTVSAASALGFRKQQHRPADRQQIVEPARHRDAGKVLAVGNEPDIGRGQKLFEVLLRHPLDQCHVRQIGIGLQVLKSINPMPRPESRK